MTQSDQRLQHLRDIMHTAGIDILALIPGANLRFLTGGVHYMVERPIVLFIPLDGQSIAVIPQLEIPLFKRHQIESLLVSWTDKEGYDDAFKNALSMLKTQGKVIGVEGIRLRFFEGELIRRYARGATVVGVDTPLARLRLHKSGDEIKALQQAITISEEALAQTLAQVQVGMSEIEVADVLERHMKALGSEEPSFNTIVHAGGNSALPHMGPLAYRIQAGDPLLLDFGAVYDGYRADITRTVFVGHVDPAFRDFYEIVKAANQAAREAVRPGIAAGEIDSIARQVFIDAGYEHLVRHRTGHGIGLETHEPPYIVEGNQQVLEPGMIFTIEQGIYEMERIGVRIEDDVLVTESGSQSLTSFNRDILIVGNH